MPHETEEIVCGPVTVGLFLRSRAVSLVKNYGPKSHLSGACSPPKQGSGLLGLPDD